MPTVRKQSVSGGTRSGRRSAHKTGVLDRISNISYDSGIKLNVYGRSGTGKTRLWSTFPGPILAVICSGGSRPGELRSIDTPENRKKIRKVILQESLELLEVISYVEEHHIDTLVLDHVTGLQDLILKEVVGLDEIPTQLAWGTATQSQYGQIGIQTKTLLRALLSLPGNVVIIAQERDFSSDGDGSDGLIMPYVASALQPSSVGWLNPACDYIGQTFIRRQMTTKELKVGKKVTRRQVATDKVEFCLRTGPDPVYTTKFRVPPGKTLPDVIVNPTYDKILQLIT